MGGWHSQTFDVMKMAQKCLILMNYLSRRFSLLGFGPELIYPVPLLSACLEKQLYLEEWESGELFCWQPKAQVSEKGAKPECISLKLLKSPETTDVQAVLSCDRLVLALKSSWGAKPLSAVLFSSLSTSLNRSNRAELWHLTLLEPAKTDLTVLCWMLC